MINTLKFILSHPLSRNNKFRALQRWLNWQIGSRLVPGPVAVPFVNDARLLVEPGMTGATGNIYCGLHEFEDMAFLLHFLRPEDKFIDVGSNVGSYTVLASKAVGCDTIAIEPIPETVKHLNDNLILNGITNKVVIHQIALGRKSGRQKMTCSEDTVNHITTDNDYAEHIDVEVCTLDDLTESGAALIKIDVEGYETEVLAGGELTLKDSKLKAVIMELNGSGKRYGFDEHRLHLNMIEKGFKTYSYDPFLRQLMDMKNEQSGRGNTLYIRDTDAVRRRLETSPVYTVGEHSL